ncbi:hypothetical protein J2S36_000219 [Arcanobacterium hippocoleae]|uniref:Uncharacterized protein n=1 Tax=Arcanobacterium hippocoleae TaxID=149017 RepID=A0ABU1SZW6_9ACTO|nr:hypothetical protein [Arcanobacterium hippocoleae]
MAMNQGKVWAGFKLVEGRSIRRYTNETQAAETLVKAGVVDVFEQKLKTITALEKQLGKARFAEILGSLVTKPAGKPCLVPEGDKRPAIQVADAATDFQPNNK